MATRSLISSIDSHPLRSLILLADFSIFYLRVPLIDIIQVFKLIIAIQDFQLVDVDSDDTGILASFASEELHIFIFSFSKIIFHCMATLFV